MHGSIVEIKDRIVCMIRQIDKAQSRFPQVGYVGQSEEEDPLRTSPSRSSGPRNGGMDAYYPPLVMDVSEWLVAVFFRLICHQTPCPLGVGALHMRCSVEFLY